MEIVLRLDGIDFLVGPLVYGECDDLIRGHLDQYAKDGRLRLLTPASVSVASFEEFVNRFRLGDGETECLVLGRALDARMASDDRKARNAGVVVLGESNVTGSLGLLRLAVQAGLMTAAEASDFYVAMVKLGAFLPNIAPEFFLTQSLEDGDG